MICEICNRRGGTIYCDRGIQVCLMCMDRAPACAAKMKSIQEEHDAKVWALIHEWRAAIPSPTVERLSKETKTP